MKKGFVKATPTIVVLISILYLLDAFYTRYFLINYNIKSSYANSGKINADVVFVGSSNVLYMVRPKVFEKETSMTMYNLASNHSAFTENEAHLAIYLKKNKKPHYLFIGISMADLTVSFCVFHPYLFTPFIKDSVIAEIVKNENPYYYYISCIPFLKYAYYNELVNYLVFQGLTNFGHPYYPKGTYNTPKGTHGFEHYHQIVKQHNGIINYDWTDKNNKDLISLIKYANSEGIEVILYEPPFWVESKKDYKGREAAIVHLQQIARENHSKLWLFDTLAICKNKGMFETVFHTNEQGSVEFTRKFAERLRNKN
jgi:hypothetical protein